MAKQEDEMKAKRQAESEREEMEQQMPNDAGAADGGEDTLERSTEVEQLKEQLMRTMAEFDNYRKRTVKEKEALRDSAVSQTVEAFLPVLDNLSRALSVSENADVKTVIDGVRMIQKQFEEVFDNLNVEPIEAVGQPFDPELHNAVMHVEDDSVGENIVVEEFVRGYMQNGRVIRHSVVKVAN